MSIPLKSGRGKRAPYTDSSAQLQALGLFAVEPTMGPTRVMFRNQEWTIERCGDPDYPWLITRLADGATRPCSSLIECVNIVKEPDEGWGFKCASS